MRFCVGVLGLAGLLIGRAETPPGARVPPTEPDRAAATLMLRPGFRAELVAAEPLVASPVALAVDEKGRALVVEMRDYSERRPERLGRIRMLTDTNLDGRMDQATVFLPDLPWPTAIACWDGGVFVGATPDIIYAKDLDGDGVADVREVVFTGFADDYAPYATNRLNVQALMNSFQWAPDGRIHGAASLSGGKVRMVDSEFTRRWRQRSVIWSGMGEKGDGATIEMARILTNAATGIDLRGRDFSFDPRTLELRAEAGGGQHGMSLDDHGRKFVCSNSDHLQLVVFDDVAAPVNPFHELPSPRRSIAADGPAAAVFRRSPDEPWRVLRTRWRVSGVTPGLVEGGGRPSGYFTGATGVTLYRGDAYGPGFAGDVFIADCGSNLIHRKRLRPASDDLLLQGERAADEQSSEFLASTDNWFRPVQFYNAPDGCLWVLDMYREVIEHPWSLPAPIKAQLDLDSGRDRGRIWRIAPAGFEVSGSRLSLPSLAPAELVDLLAHPNGWHRDTAARLLYERGDSNTVAAMRSRAADWERAFPKSSPEEAARGRIRLLHLLNNSGALRDSELLAALHDPDASVRRQAVHLAGERVARVPEFVEALQRAANTETNGAVAFEVALALASAPPAERGESLAALALSDSPWVRSAAIHAAGRDGLELWMRLVPGAGRSVSSSSAAALVELAESLGRQGDTEAATAVLTASVQLTPLELACEVADALGVGLQRAGVSLRSCDRSGALARLVKTTFRQSELASTDGIAPAAVRLWSWLPAGEALPFLVPRLASGTPPEIQQAALTAVSRLGGEEWARGLASALASAPAESRPRLLALLAARIEGVRELFRQLGQEGSPIGLLDPVTIAALRNHRLPEVRKQARDLWGAAPESRQTVVENFVTALDTAGDAARGAVLFRERCANCHAFQGQGVALGPDLASVAANGREKLLVAILDPNREVAPNLSAWTAETVSGDTVTGVLVRRTPESVTLRLAGGGELTLPSSSVRELRPDGRSLMPEGLEAGLSPAALADLLAFLTTR